MKHDINTYIRRTASHSIPDAYDLNTGDLRQLRKMALTCDIIEVIHLAFLFGRAKGIRYARKEASRV